MKAILNILLGGLLVGLSSCLELTEQVRVREGGSGQFTFTVDISQAKPFLEMAKGLSEENSPNAASSDLNTGMEDVHARLQSVKGIHNAAVIKSRDGLLSGITFEFDNMEALNKAMNVVHNNKGTTEEKYFAWSGKQLHRFNTPNIENEIKSKAGDDFEGLDLTVNGKSMKELMNGMVYRTEYIFDKPIKRVSNSSATLSPDKRKVTLERYLLDDTRKPSSLENKIEW